MSDTPISLLDRLRLQPSSDSWQRLVDLYSPLVATWLRRFELQSADADDLLQEVLSVLVRELAQFRHDQRTGAFRCWLRTITVNRVRIFWRARNARPAGTGYADLGQMAAELEDSDSGLSKNWDKEHDEHVARKLLELIQPEFASTTWTAFRRVVLDGERASTVAGELGVSIETVWQAKSRVLRRLRQEASGLID